MTLLTTNSDIQYSGFTGQDTFAYNFRVDLKTDMFVTIDGVDVLQGDFSMTGLGDAVGGDVILNTPLVANAIVILSRGVQPTQEVDYQAFDAFPAETHEGALDKLTMLVQQIGIAVLRSIRFPVGDLSNPVLPDIAGRANRFLAFDASGEISLTTGTGGGDPNAVQKPPGVVIDGNLIEFNATKDAEDSGESVNSLMAYTDAGDSATLTSAQNYADVGDDATLVSAKSYADGGDTATLSNANAYTDAQIATINNASIIGETLADATVVFGVGFTDSKPQGNTHDILFDVPQPDEFYIVLANAVQSSSTSFVEIRDKTINGFSLITGDNGGQVSVGVNFEVKR